MAGPETFNPAVLKPSMKTSGGDLKPSLVTSNYSGGTPGAGDLKPSLLKSDGDLKESLLSGGSLKNALLSGVSFASVVADAVGYWPLQDDAASTVVVGEAGGNGTLNGGNNTADLSTTGPSAAVAKSLLLDGTADYISTPFTTATPTLTAAIWAKSAPGTTSNYRQFFCKGNVFFATTFEFALSWRPHPTPASASVRCYFKDATGTLRSFGLADPAANGVTMTDWNWFLVTIESGSQNFYINNQLVGSSTETIGAGTSIPVTIGRGNQNDGQSDEFAGNVAQAILWNRVLSPTERAAVFAG